MAKNKMTRLNVWLTYDQKIWLAKQAEETGSSSTAVVRALVLAAMKEEK